MQEKKSARLDSLDALRGFDMFFITGGAWLLKALAELVYGRPETWMAVQMRHVEWGGLHFYDLIFPLFVFITGVTFPFSTDKRLARGDSRKELALNILRRTLLLVFFGLLFEEIQKFDWPNLRVWSVIGRIGLVWGIAATMTLFLKTRTCVVFVLFNLLGWWLFLRFVPSPEASGADPMATSAGCYAGWFDTHYLTTAHRHEGGLATLAMLPTAFFGIWAGRYLKLQKPGLTENGRVIRMMLVALAAVAVGWIWALPSWGCPVVKNIWTGSYALVAGGFSLFLLALFYWLIDVKGWKAWSFYFRVIGMNAIAIYLFQRFVPFREIGLFFIGPFAGWLSFPGWASLVDAVARCLTGWLFLYFLYRQKIFLKV